MVYNLKYIFYVILTNVYSKIVFIKTELSIKKLFISNILG